MKNNLLALFALIVVALPCQSQTDDATKMMNMMAYMTPGAPHKIMATMDGTWAYEMSFKMHPDSPEMKTVGTATYKMIMNGLYQTSTYKGNIMGMPFEGMSIMGYDNAKKKFVSSWVDNMGSGIMTMEGPWDEATKTITLTGTGINPETLMPMTMKETMKMVDNNTWVYDMYSVVDGKEVKMMSIKSTRSK